MMTTIFDSLPEPVRAKALERAAQLGLPATDMFLLSLIDDVAERRAALEAMLLESLDSGPGVEADEAFWAERLERLRARTSGEVAM